MTSGFPALSHADVLIPGLENQEAQFSQVYSENCHRIYSLAFWMTDHEQIAEQVATNTFLAAFASSRSPSAEQIDQALLAEVRKLRPLAALSLPCQASSLTISLLRNL